MGVSAPCHSRLESCLTRCNISAGLVRETSPGRLGVVVTRTFLLEIFLVAFVVDSNNTAAAAVAEVAAVALALPLGGVRRPYVPL
jgi:hypothetical protein